MEIVFQDEVKIMLDQFDLKIDQCRSIMQLLEEEIKKGLSAETQRCAEVKMFPSYVTKLPSGREEGQYLSLDLGGTNYRVFLVTLKRNEPPEIFETTYNIPHETMQGKGVELFNFIAKTLEDFLSRQKNIKWPLKLSFTFSFPCRQQSLDNAILIRWTKGFNASDCEGENVVNLLQTAIDNLKLNVKCVAIVNDTVGTLVSCALEDPRCRIGVIAGTGTNAAYIEDINKVQTFQGSTEEVDYVIVNMELGTFGDNGSLNKFRTYYDVSLDEESAYPKIQIFEKMTSGTYLGELVRIVLLDLIKKNYLFRGVVPPSLEKPGSFHTKYLYEVERDPPHLFYFTFDVLKEDLNVLIFEDMDAAIVRAVCERITTRAANLLGTGIACLLNRINKDDVTVGIDGSLYKFHKKFEERMINVIHHLKKSNLNFIFKLSENGSGKGAAAIAASNM